MLISHNPTCESWWDFLYLLLRESIKFNVRVLRNINISNNSAATIIMSRLSKTILSIGLIFLIYGYLCRLLKVDFFWDSKMIGWIVLFIALLSYWIDLRRTRIQRGQKNNLGDNRDLHFNFWFSHFASYNFYAQGF